MKTAGNVKTLTQIYFPEIIDSNILSGDSNPFLSYGGGVGSSFYRRVVAGRMLYFEIV